MRNGVRTRREQAAQNRLACCAAPQALLGGLVGLSSLQLEGVGGLTDEHVVALSALTSLTSLGVMAVSNQHVTNAAMAALTTLTALRKLTWHVGASPSRPLHRLRRTLGTPVRGASGV